MSETREPTFLVLDWNEDFKLDAHVDADGQQRFAVMGYIQKRKGDGLYQAPLIPELFFGENGEQLHTWSQYLTAGDHTILRRDSGNPTVPDHELAWRKISETHERRQAQPTQTTVTYEIPVLPIALLIAVPLGLYLAYKALK